MKFLFIFLFWSHIYFKITQKVDGNPETFEQSKEPDR